MKSLSEAEAGTVALLLAGESSFRGAHHPAFGMSGRTFERIRKTAYSDGWVYDRFVPVPSATGIATICVAIATPYADELQRVRGAWLGLSHNVVIWNWPDTIFAVFVTADAAQASVQTLDGIGGNVVAIAVPTEEFERSLPVYFDYEGAWCRWTGLYQPNRYPQSLYRARVRAEKATSNWAAINALVSRPVQPASAGGPLRVNPYFFPRSEQRALREGRVVRRTMLDVQRIPPFRQRSIEHVVFVTGESRGARGGYDLFRALPVMGVFPFLYISDQHRVLFGALSPAPPNSVVAHGPPAIMKTLERYMTKIVIRRLPVRTLQVELNHRYDRLQLPL